jgi:hypothetical protein
VVGPISVGHAPAYETAVDAFASSAQLVRIESNVDLEKHGIQALADVILLAYGAG